MAPQNENRFNNKNPRPPQAAFPEAPVKRLLN
jgi:hypothetical protein